MFHKRGMSAKEPHTYPYADVERALAAVFGVDAVGRAGWLRGRLQHFRRLGLTPDGPGKGKTIAYAVEDIDKWLIGLEMAHLRLDPTLIVELIKRNWGPPDDERNAAEAFDRGEATLRDLVTVARSHQSPADVLVTVTFDAMAKLPAIVGYTTMLGIDSFGGWIGGDDREKPRRASIFDLSDRIRRLDRALAAPPPPPLPGGLAGQILRAARRARGEK
jgi:hypothetical protein